MIKLLVVEDDKVLSNNIKEILAAIGEITQVYDGSEGLFELESGVYDLAILDLMMPEMNGYEVLAKIRKEKIQTPVLILTAKDSLEDKIEGFERGADDYLTKPFYREELIMRVKALLKRSLGLFDENVLKYKDISCDLKSNEVLYKEQVLPVQGKEFELLVYFLQNKGIILTKKQRSRFFATNVAAFAFIFFLLGFITLQILNQSAYRETDLSLEKINFDSRTVQLEIQRYQQGDPFLNPTQTEQNRTNMEQPLIPSKILN